MEVTNEFCDVSLPVPVDRPFTYRLPETLRHRVKAGCRVLVPFGPRKLAGVALAVHNRAPEAEVKELLKLVEEEPVFSNEMLELGQWVSAYYCAPLGEVLRGMAPLGGQVRRTRVYSLTDGGRDTARQLVLGTGKEDPALVLLRLLERRALSASYLKVKVPGAARVLRELQKKGLVELEEDVTQKDPLRAPAGQLLASFEGRPEGVKLTKTEKEVVAYLELHPGGHNLRLLDELIPGASQAVRRLARRKQVRVELESVLKSVLVERPPHVLNESQQAAFHQIREALEAHRFTTFLLHGVTGSGKTEVYLNAIDACLALGRGALLLVPEIALTPAVAAQFVMRFGKNVAILHSAFNDSERAGQWRSIREGKCRVVVATRSGVFAPVQELGLILVDEEHDHSYKQEETPRYNGRDVAIVRSHAANAVVVLGSATPSLESRYNAERQKYQLLELPERVGGRPLPHVEVVDMRAEFLETRRHATFSRRLVEAVQDRLANGEQAMLLLNRRGFSCFVSCRKCGERMQCANCAITLTYHRRDNRMLCHYCNHAEKVPKVCPSCGSEYIQFIGVGSERVEAELHQAFPEARIARLDRDTVTGKRRYETILAGFREREYDILVGTQMIAKGHDIPNVTLVGVVSADIGLGMPDFRAAERTFQLLTQVAGRAGRGDLPGQVVLQTLNPDHYAVRFASEQNYEKFYEKELQFRRMMRYPPFGALANVLVRAEKQEDAMRRSGELGKLLEKPMEGLRVMGPAEAPVARLKAEFRYQLLLKASSRRILKEALDALRSYAEREKWPAVGLVIDVDPLSLM